MSEYGGRYKIFTLSCQGTFLHFLPRARAQVHHYVHDMVAIATIFVVHVYCILIHYRTSWFSFPQISVSSKGFCSDQYINSGSCSKLALHVSLSHYFAAAIFLFLFIYTCYFGIPLWFSWFLYSSLTTTVVGNVVVVNLSFLIVSSWETVVIINFPHR